MINAALARWLLSVAILLGGIVGTPTRSSAGTIPVGGSQLWLYDGAAAGCSTCSASVLFELLTATTLKITFENTSTDGQAGKNVLTGIGFDTTPTLSNVSVHSQALENGKTWSLGGGIGAGNWEIGAKSTNGANGGLDNQSSLLNSGWLILTWQSPMLVGLNIDASVAKFQNTGLNGASIHAPGAPTPEPGTLALIGSGSALLAILRRRSSLRARPRH